MALRMPQRSDGQHRPRGRARQTIGAQRADHCSPLRICRRPAARRRAPPAARARSIRSGVGRTRQSSPSTRLAAGRVAAIARPATAQRPPRMRPQRPAQIAPMSCDAVAVRRRRPAQHEAPRELFARLVESHDALARAMRQASAEVVEAQRCPRPPGSRPCAIRSRYCCSTLLEQRHLDARRCDRRAMKLVRLPRLRISSTRPATVTLAAAPAPAALAGRRPARSPTIARCAR